MFSDCSLITNLFGWYRSSVFWKVFLFILRNWNWFTDNLLVPDFDIERHFPPKTTQFQNFQKTQYPASQSDRLVASGISVLRILISAKSTVQRVLLPLFLRTTINIERQQSGNKISFHGRPEAFFLVFKQSLAKKLKIIDFEEFIHLGRLYPDKGRRICKLLSG